MTYSASIIGSANSINDVESFAPLITASTAIRKPNTDFPEEPDIILGDGNAKNSSDINVPDIKIPNVEENIENVLTPTIKIKKNITKEYDSIKPGEPPTHLTLLIQRINHKKRIISPGNAKENGKLKISKDRVDIAKLTLSFPIMVILDKSNIDIASINDANP